MGKLAFRPGTTIVYHKDLLSFLHDRDLRIFHRKYSDLEYKVIEDLHNRRSLERNILIETFIEELQNERIIGEYDNKTSEILYSPKTQLLHLLVEVTNLCNMDCLYCYTEANEHLQEERELSGDEWIDLFERVRIKGRFVSQNVSLTGGEPTIHPSFDRILRYLSGKYKVEISSNGLHYTKPVLDAILECETLHFLNISTDSSIKEEDERMRGGGTFKKRIKNLELLSDHNIPLCIGIVVSTINLDSLEQTTAYYLEKFPGISIKYIPLTNIGRASRFEDNRSFLIGKEAIIFNEKIIAMKEKYGKQILSDPSDAIKKTSHWSGRCYHMKYQFQPLTFKDAELPPERCNAGYGVVDISPSGRLRPCLRADSFFRESLILLPKNEIMPKIGGNGFSEEATLNFWDYVTQEVTGFNPIETCAFKTVIKRVKGKYEYL